MKNHRRKSRRRMTGGMKAAISALLVSSMVLNPWYGIDFAIGAENSSTSVSVSGFTGGTVKVNLESSTLREEALRAIRESEPAEVDRFLSTDADTDAAFENLLKDPNPYYIVNVWTADDEALFEEEGIDVQILVQKDLTAEEEESIVTPSDLKKTDVKFDASVKKRKDKEIAFYPAGGTLDNLISSFQSSELTHAFDSLTEEDTAISTDNSEYLLTGEEKITILYTNTAKKSHNFKLSIDGKSYASGVKVAGTTSTAKSILNKLKAIMKGEETTAVETLETAEANAVETTSGAMTTSGTMTTSGAMTTSGTMTTSGAMSTSDSKSASAAESTSAAKADTTEAETKKEAEVKKETAARVEKTTAETAGTVSETAGTKAEKAAETKSETKAEAGTTEEKDGTTAADSDQKKIEAAAKETTEAETEPELQTGAQTTIRMGSFTLDKFFDEGAFQEVKTEEKKETAGAAKETEARETTESAKESVVKIVESEAETSDNSDQKKAAAAAEAGIEEAKAGTTEAESTKAAVESTEASKTGEMTTAAETEGKTKETTAAASAEAEAKTEAASTAAKSDTRAAGTGANADTDKANAGTAANKTTETETAVTAAETTRAETSAKTAMDESLAAEQKTLLQDVTAEELAEELSSGKVVQYTLGELTDEFLSVSLTDADSNDAYTVRVYPVYEGSIGEGWTLHAREVVRSGEDAITDDAAEMSEATKEALEAKGLYNDSASLDIYFEDRNGNEVEPNGAVHVEIEVSTAVLPENVNPDTLAIYHLEESDGEITNVSNVATGEDVKTLDSDGEVISKKDAVVTETVEADTAEAEEKGTASEGNASAEAVGLSEDDTAVETTNVSLQTADTSVNTVETQAEEADQNDVSKKTTSTEFSKLSDEVAAVKMSFDVKSFSTFTISWTSGSWTSSATVKYVYLDSDGQEQEIPNGALPTEIAAMVSNGGSISASASYASGITLSGDISGYSYSTTKYKSASWSDETEIQPYLQSKSSKKGKYSWQYKDTSGNWQTISGDGSTPEIKVYYTKNASSVSIDKSTVSSNGLFTVKLSDELQTRYNNGELRYVWYRCADGKSAQNDKATDGTADEHFDENTSTKVNGYDLVSKTTLNVGSGDSVTTKTVAAGLNVVLDHAQHNTTAAAKNYYYVVVYDQNGNEVGRSDSEEVTDSEGYYELQNGCFESPDINNAHSQVNEDSVTGWKTTARMNSGTKDNIEIINVGNDNRKATDYTYYGVNTAACTKTDASTNGAHAQFAELNCESQGSLYQDVITAPGTTMNWQLSHATRKDNSQPHLGSAYDALQNGGTFGNSGITTTGNQFFDTMYLLIMPTSSISENGEYTNGDETFNVESQEGVLALSKAVVQSPSAYPGVYVKEISTNYKDGWKTYTGTYTVPQNQYETRFFFVSGETAYDKIPKYKADGTDITYTTTVNGKTETGTKYESAYKKTIGNLLDNISFTTDPVTVTDEGKVKITKKVTGVSQDNAADLDGYSVTVTIREKDATGTGDTRSISSFQWDSTRNCFVGDTGYFNLEVGKTYTITESVTAGDAFNAKYEVDTANSTTSVDDVTPTRGSATERTFTNAYTYSIPTPTGVHRDIMPYVLTIGIALAGAALILIETERRKRFAETQ